MKTERELYQEHYKNSRDYKFYVKHEITEKQIFDFKSGRYSVDCVNDGWKIWQASANREGYKLVPTEMHWHKADDLASAEWDKSKALFCSVNRDMTTIQVEEFRLRWCKNKAHQIMNDYKTMIGAV